MRSRTSLGSFEGPAAPLGRSRRGRDWSLLQAQLAARLLVRNRLLALSLHLGQDTAAKTFHDGKWMATIVDNARVVADLKRLLALKRTPQVAAATKRPATGRRAALARPRDRPRR